VCGDHNHVISEKRSILGILILAMVEIGKQAFREDGIPGLSKVFVCVGYQLLFCKMVRPLPPHLHPPLFVRYPPSLAARIRSSHFTFPPVSII
jgi:hypothetical protein